MTTSFFIRKKISASMAASCSGQHRSLPFDQVKSILVLYEAKDVEHVVRRRKESVPVFSLIRV